MPEDNSSYALSVAQDALSAARDAQSTAHQAQSAAEHAQRTADRALDVAQEAMQLARELEARVDRLERAVEHLISILQQRLDTLIEETREVRRSVDTQGQGIQERVDQTTESVRDGFTTAGRQEAENRLLDSRTALMGLVARLTMAQTTLQERYDQARRQTDAQKKRFSELVQKTIEALNIDVGRVGARILQIKNQEFEPLVRRTEAARAPLPGAFDVAQQVGRTSLAQRSAAMAPHVGKLSADLGAFATQRLGLVDALRPFAHPGLRGAAGLRALRVYFVGSGDHAESVVAAEVQVDQQRIAVRKVADGLGKLAFTKAWDTAGPRATRTLTLDELKRLHGYIDLLQAAGVLTPQELGIIRHHVEHAPFEIRTPSAEVVP